MVYLDTHWLAEMQALFFKYTFFIIGLSQPRAKGWLDVLGYKDLQIPSQVP